MARTIHRLKPITLSRKMPPGYHADGGGLYLQVTDADAKSWIFRFSLNGKRREMGLGPYKATTDNGSETVVVSLKSARDEAGKARALVKAGRDPIETRNAKRAEDAKEAARGVTFDKAAELFLKDHKKTWKNPKHRQQWENTLKTYASPVIGNLAVADVDTPHVTKILDPIWAEKVETASRVRGRIERVLDWSKVRGYRTGENPARWRGHLDKIYPAKTKVRRPRHHAAVPIDDMPAVYAKLCKANGIAALAARFTILTAVRVSETTGATDDEFPHFPRTDIWSISAERMKAERDHNIPLSREAKAVLKEVAEFRTDKRIFPGHRRGRPLSQTAVIKALRRAGAGDATTHGCRSTFKDWASERTNFANEVSEMALAHAIGDKVEAAYRRGDLMKKRTALMEAWSGFVSNPRNAKVVSIGERRRAS